MKIYPIPGNKKVSFYFNENDLGKPRGFYIRLKLDGLEFSIWLDNWMVKRNHFLGIDFDFFPPEFKFIDYYPDPLTKRYCLDTYIRLHCSTAFGHICFKFETPLPYDH